MAIWKFKRLFHYVFFFVCFYFIISKDQVPGECVTEKPDRTHPGLQPQSSGSEPSLSRQRRQNKREQPEHGGEERQVSRELRGVSHCSAAWEIDFV